MLRFRQRGVPGRGSFPGLTPEMTQLLRNRGVDTEEKAEKYLHPSLQDLCDPYLMQDMDKAVRLIREAVAGDVPVQIYGDYDTDGVTATAIMLTLFERLGGRADYRIPSRHTEGYGLNCEAIREIAKGHGLLITVDCGITSHEEVRLARELGMKVIVTDHHQLPETPVPADAVLNPLLGSYPFRRLCGAGVAMKVVQAILGMPGVMEVLDLAALATVADIVPLIDENRVIVSFGLREMEKNRRPGLAVMMQKAACTLPLKSDDLAYRLGPRINAGGRLEEAGQCVELLTSKDPDVIERIASHLEENNRHRQMMQNEITKLAVSQMQETVDFYDDRAIVIMGKNWNTGVIGLAAGKLCEKYHMPAVVLTDLGDRAVGSCRSIPGVNIYAMLSQCADLFIRFGGHEQAAGLTMDPALVPELRRRLNLYIRKDCDDECFIPCADYDMPLHMEQVTLNLIDELQALEPTGFANPPAHFYCPDARVQEAKAVGMDGSHLKLTLFENQALREGIAFQMGSMLQAGLDRVDVLFAPERNEFRGMVKPQVQVKSMRRAEGAGAVPSPNSIFPLLLQEICMLSSNYIQNTAEPLPVITRSQALAEARGTLLVGHRSETAREIAAMGEMDVAKSRVEDPRPFRTLLLCPDLTGLRDCWKKIVLLDGDVLPGEAARIRELCPRAELLAFRPGAFLSDLRELQLSTDTLREVYKRLRAGGPRDGRTLMADLGLSFGPFLVALETLSEIDLIQYTLRPFSVTLRPMKKASPDDSRIMRYLRSIKT